MVIESVDIFKGLDYRNFLNPARLYEFSSFPALLYKAVDLFWIAAEILMVLLRSRFFYLFELMHPCIRRAKNIEPISKPSTTPGQTTRHPSTMRGKVLIFLF